MSNIPPVHVKPVLISIVDTCMYSPPSKKKKL
jgi:hypothetical protein